MWLRAAVLGPVVLLSGAVSHVAADGLLPSPVVMALVLVACTALSAAFLRSRASALRLVALVVGGQAATHLLLSATAGHQDAASAAAPTTGPSAGPALQAVADDAGRRVGSLSDHFDAASAAGGRAGEAVTAGPTNQVLGHLVDHTLAQGPLMLLAHTLGAVALGLWLAAGESALWHLLVLASVRARVAVTLQVALLPLRASALGGLDAARRLPVPPLLLLSLERTLPHRLVTRRGPPFLLAA
ncbi:hypothetical protein JOE61_003913 [Nocardioides salarius]|uniref:Integral membrane protein n=1 Tax=Nocardioides salarius TaxID=374513 RepID=A0ABS2MFX8_9ACTN|nr:hypothetical protein [Nocardioides salarius]MBM7510099.1 hypothetical protein [Nocardioides salarius]